MVEMCQVNWSSLAPWVQAIGSVAAIFVAIRIGKTSDERARDLVERERRRQAEMVIRSFSLKLHKILAASRSIDEHSASLLLEIDKGPLVSLPGNSYKGNFLLTDADNLTAYTDRALLLDGAIGMFVLDVIDATQMTNEYISNLFDKNGSTLVHAIDLKPTIEQAISANKKILALLENTAGAIANVYGHVTPTLKRAVA